MGTCPFCQRGALWIITAITSAAVIRTQLYHLKLATAPPLEHLLRGLCQLRERCCL